LPPSACGSCGADEAALKQSLVKARRAEILKPLVAKHHGRIIKFIGDGVLIEFASAVNAVACAGELQAAMNDANETHRRAGSRTSA
jgi:adenylate cyclase